MNQKNSKKQIRFWPVLHLKVERTGPEKHRYIDPVSLWTMRW